MGLQVLKTGVGVEMGGMRHTFSSMNSVTITEAGILSRLIQPGTGGWDKAAATAILSFSFSADDRERMLVLLEKAKAAELDEAEQNELASFQKAGRTLELIKARARLSLKQAAA